MADANQLKIRARREEAAGDYEQASRLYLEALSAMDEGGNLSDPSLLVRVADLEYRQDDRESALDYYLQAVDEYADQGLITNAIAVCNKILRVFPDQVECHRRLADLHMDVGLTAEARQNLLRFAEEAWDPGTPDQVLDAMGAFLERTPDQEVALEYASRLQEVGRERDALDALKSVWEERTESGADVEALKKKAEEIHSETGDRAAGEVVAGGPGDGALADATAERVLANGGDDWSEEPGGRPDRGEPARQFARGGVPAGPDRELELVASYRERFIEVHRPSQGEAPALPEEARDAMPGEPSGEGAPRPEDEAPSDGGRAALSGPTADEARSTESTEGDETRSPTPDIQQTTDGDAETMRGSREEEVMEELNGRNRGSDVDDTSSATDALEASDRGGWEEDDLPTLDPKPEGPEVDDRGMSPVDDVTSGDAGDRGRADGPEMPSDGQELGEEAELRRGLELVDEMLEVQPENLELRERKLRYARRLGDEDTLVEASLDFADALAKDGARRSARALYRRVLELDPENQAAESGLARLDVGELEEKRQSGKRAGAAHATPEAASPEEQEARRELGMRLWTEFENSIREMPWLHAATQAYQATGPDARPPLETFEMLAHYLVARGRYRDAAEILERALELAGEGDEELPDVLYYLGRAHEKLGENEQADEYYERLERVDPDFARVRSTLADDDPDPRA